MTQQRKRDWIRRFSPGLYALGLALVCLYIGLRSRSWLNTMVSWESGWLVLLLLAGFYLLNMLMCHKRLAGNARIRSYIAGVSTFLVLYGFMAIAGADLIQLVLRMFIRDESLRLQIFQLAGFVCLIFTAGFALYGWLNTKHFRVTEDRVTLPGLTENCRVVLLTDLHIGYFVGPRHIRRMVDRVNALRPDMVVIAGDLINAGNTRECRRLPEVARELSHLRSREGTFAVTGNHDPAPADPDFRKFLEDAHITLLQDEAREMRCFRLIGRNTCTRPRKALQLLTDHPKDRADVVLDHDPIGVPEARQEKVSLILCGHTHRGQVFPLNLFVRMLYSREQFGGLSEQDGTHVLVSSGAGFFSMPMRVGSHCEIVSIDLKKP